MSDRETFGPRLRSERESPRHFAGHDRRRSNVSAPIVGRPQRTTFEVAERHFAARSSATTRGRPTRMKSWTSSAGCSRSGSPGVAPDRAPDPPVTALTAAKRGDTSGRRSAFGRARPRGPRPCRAPAHRAARSGGRHRHRLHAPAHLRSVLRSGYRLLGHARGHGGRLLRGVHRRAGEYPRLPRCRRPPPANAHAFYCPQAPSRRQPLVSRRATSD